MHRCLKIVNKPYTSYLNQGFNVLNTDYYLFVTLGLVPCFL
jgi:hypothetical protein